MIGEHRSDEMAASVRYGLVALFIIAAAFAVFAPQYWRTVELGKSALYDAEVNGRLYHHTYPAYNYTFGRLRTGDLPLWNPRQLCGYALSSDPGVGLYQPLNVIFALLPTEQAMAVHAFICLLMMGLGMTLFLRALDCAYWSAAFGGVVFAFSGAAAAAMSRPDVAGTLAWSPFVLWALREYGRAFRMREAVFIGLALGLMTLAGNAAMIVALLSFIVPYGVLLILTPEPGAQGFRRRVSGLVMAGMIGLGLGAIHWLPFLGQAVRLDQPLATLLALDVAGAEPVKPWDFVVHAFTTEPGALPRLGWMGILPLLFVPAAVLQKQRSREWALALVLAAIVVSLMFFMREAWPSIFPRAALMYTLALCTAILAALGIDRVVVPRRGHRARPIVLPLVVVLVTSGVLFWLFPWEVRMRLLAAVIVLASFAILRARWLAVACGAIFCIIAALDLTIATRNQYRHPAQDAPTVYRTAQGAIDQALAEALGGRLHVVTGPEDQLNRGLTPNLGLLQPAPMAGGMYLPLTRGQMAWWDYVDHKGDGKNAAAGRSYKPEYVPPLIAFTGVRAAITSPLPTTEANVEYAIPLPTDDPNGTVHRLPKGLPRAYWVGDIVPAANAKDYWVALGGEFDPDSQVTVDTRGRPELATGFPGTGTANPLTRHDAQCSVEDLDPERVVLRVDAPATGMTVLLDSYAPGWRVTLDGVRVPVYEVNGLFRGVLTPKGEHTIEMVYRPFSFYLGLGVSCGTLALTALAGLFTATKGHRTRKARRP